MGAIRANIGLSKNLILFAGLLLLGLAVACGGSSSSSDGSSSGNLVPQRATVIGSVASDERLDAIQLDESSFMEMIPSSSDGDKDGFGEFFKLEQFKSGGLFGEVSRLDIFGEISDEVDLDYFGVVLHGSFEETALIAELESVSGRKLVKRDYKDSNVYSPAESSDASDEFELSVLDDSTFVLGTGGAMNDVIDIKVGDADSASGPLMDKFNTLSDGLFGIAFNMPQDLGESEDLGAIPGLGDLPISMEFLSSLQIVGVGGDINNGSLDVAVTMDFTDEEAAESLEGFITGIVALASGFVPDPKMAGLLGGLEVNREGTQLTINASVPVADIPDLFGDLTSVAGTETSTDSAMPPGTPEIRMLASALGEEIPLLGANHIDEGQKAEYNSTPPTSGEHWPAWADCGFYSEGLPDERIVHNLEHGNIVVSYNFANPALVTQLRETLEDVPQFENWGLARSYNKIAEGQVALAAWGQLNIVQGVSIGEIGLFFESLAGNLGPERVPC